MSERPKWMPTHEDVEEQSDLHIGWVDDEAMQFLYHIGLRAQIAVLGDLRTTWVEAVQDDVVYLREIELACDKIRAEIAK